MQIEDVTIVLVENTREDWSFGNGVAQYLTMPNDQWKSRVLARTASTQHSQIHDTQWETDAMRGGQIFGICVAILGALFIADGAVIGPVRWLRIAAGVMFLIAGVLYIRRARRATSP